MCSLNDESEAPGVIDWAEAQLGDPAYDLAVVLRGARKPLGLADGRGRLLAAHAELADEPLTATAVGLYELALLVDFWRQEVDRLGPDSQAGSAAAGQIRRMLRMLGA